MADDSISKKLDDIAVQNRVVQITKAEFDTHSRYRHRREEILLKMHFNYNAEYQTNEANDTTSKAFVGATRPRVQAGASMLIPTLMPPGQEPWSIDPTPVPEIPGMEMIEGADSETMMMAMLKQAERAAKEKSLKVSDQLTEGQFRRKLQDGVLEAALYGTAVFIGPFVRTEGGVDPEELLTGEQSLIGVEMMGTDKVKYVAEFDVCSVWDSYPDPFARCVDECDSVIFRKIMSRSQIRALRNRSDFDADEVDGLLKDHPSGCITDQWWESVINTFNSDTNTRDNRYEVLVRWGFISGDDLRKAGLTISDSRLNDQIMCQAWVCGNRLLFLGESTLHKDRIPAYFVPWSRVPNSIWGVGVAESMSDSQDAINACERSKMDNMALSARPQLVVDVSRLAPGHNNLEIKSGKIWPVVPSEVSNADPIRAINIPSMLNELNVVQASHINFVQEQTSIPNNLMGLGGEGIHNRTAAGASLQFNNAISALKGVVFNFETYYIVPFIQAMSRFVDEFDPTETQGDVKVKALGLSGLLHREAVSGALAQFMAMATQSPEMAQRMDPDRIFTMMLKGSGLMLEKITFSEQEYQQRMQAQMEQEATGRLAEQEMQMQMQRKQKAETAPNDALLQVYNETEEGTPLKIAIGAEVLNRFGVMTEEIQKAMDAQLQMASIRMTGEAHSVGSEMADRETEDPTMNMRRR